MSISKFELTGEYLGYFQCGGKYEIRLDDSGKEMVDCFFEDMTYCIEKIIPCLGVGFGDPGLPVPSDPRVKVSGPTCKEQYIFLEDLIDLIKNQ